MVASDKWCRRNICLHPISAPLRLCHPRTQALMSPQPVEHTNFHNTWMPRFLHYLIIPFEQCWCSWSLRIVYSPQSYLSCSSLLFFMTVYLLKKLNNKKRRKSGIDILFLFCSWNIVKISAFIQNTDMLQLP